MSRLTDETLDTGHTVERLPINGGVEAPSADYENFDPHGAVLNPDRGRTLRARHVSRLSRIRRRRASARSSMDEHLRSVEDADKVLSFG